MVLLQLNVSSRKQSNRPRLKSKDTFHEFDINVTGILALSDNLVCLFREHNATTTTTTKYFVKLAHTLHILSSEISM